MTKTELTMKLSNIENISALATQIAEAADDTAVLEILKQHNLELTAEDVRTLLGEEGELNEESLDAVTGGCKCKGPLKRLVGNFLKWLGKRVGVDFSCPECGD